jgi:hypothetical protein
MKRALIHLRKPKVQRAFAILREYHYTWLAVVHLVAATNPQVSGSILHGVIRIFH